MLHLLLSTMLAMNFLPQQNEMEANAHMDIQFDVQAVPEETELVLHFTVHNQTNNVVELQFNSSQKYDYEIFAEDGKMIYRFSDGKAFLQMIQTENLSPGEKKAWHSTWKYESVNDNAISPGTYKVRAKFLGQVIEPKDVNVNDTAKTTFEYGQGQHFSNISIEGKDGEYKIKGQYKGPLPLTYSVEDGHYLLVKKQAVQLSENGDFLIKIQVDEKDLPKNGSLIAYLSANGEKGEPVKLEDF